MFTIYKHKHLIKLGLFFICDVTDTSQEFSDVITKCGEMAKKVR